MTSGKPINISQQLSDLFKKEEMLAFFDIQLNLAGQDTAAGICKISKLREGEGQSKYMSVFLIIDVPADVIRAKVHAMVQSVAWENLVKEIPGSKTIYPIPYPSISPELYIIEIDVYLQPSVSITKSFLTRHLHPAITRLVGGLSEEVVFWDDRPTAPPGMSRPLLHKIISALGWS